MSDVAARIHVIVLHWGDPAVTASCLDSLRDLPESLAEVVVIDNGTPDRSGERLAESHARFTHLRHERNLGFAGGNNAAMRRALERGAEAVLLLNNDAELTPGALISLSAALEQPRVGLVNPKILHHDPPQTIWYAGGKHSLWAGHSRHCGRGESDRGQHDRAGEVTFVTGCALLIRREVLEQVGLFDESLFMYAEDLDLGLRARRAGWRLWYEPAATVIHREKVLRRKTVADPFRLRLATRNALRVNWRHASLPQRITFVPWFGLRWVLYLTVKNLLLGFPGDAAAVWRGVFDAVRGRMGSLESVH